MRRTCFTIERQSLILQEPSSTVGDIPRKIAVLPYAGWDLKIYQKRIEDRVSSTKKDQERTKKSGPTRSKWFESMWACKWNFRNSEAMEIAAGKPCNATKSLREFFSPFHVAIICRTNLWGGQDANWGPSETSLFKGHKMAGRTWFLGWIRQHSWH